MKNKVKECFSASGDDQLHGEARTTPQAGGGYQRAWNLWICHRVGNFLYEQL